MLGWIWLSGFGVTFVMLFMASVIVSRAAAADGKDIDEVLRGFAEYIFACLVFSLLSWLAMALSIAMLIIIAARKKDEV